MKYLALIFILVFNIQCKDSVESNRRNAKSIPEKAPVGDDSRADKSKEDSKDVADKEGDPTDTGTPDSEGAPGDPTDPGTSDPSTDPTDPGTGDPAPATKADCDGGATFNCNGNMATLCVVEGGSKTFQQFNVSSCPVQNLQLSCDGNDLVIKYKSGGSSRDNSVSLKNCPAAKSKLESQM